MDLWWRLQDGFTDLRTRFEQWVLGERHALHSIAAVRIGTGLAVIGLLLSNYTSRDIWVGQASVWAAPARSVSGFPELVLLRDASGDIVTLFYWVTILAALALALGWRTRAANVVTFIGFIAIVGQNPVVGVAGDNLIRLTLLWLLLTRAGERWSLDARREPAEVLPSWLNTMLHNAGLVALAVQTIIAYTASGLGKVARPEWQDGTALYYTLQLPESRPFPGLSDLLSSSELVLAVLTYAVLLSHLFFAPLLISRVPRLAVMATAASMSVLFGVLFAAPWSQLAVVAVTLLFVPERLWQELEDRVLGVYDSLAERVEIVWQERSMPRSGGARRAGHQIVTRCSGSSHSESSSVTSKAS